ncbi:DeoR/GlpR family DNA-binding transcription regulator [Marinovum sp. 2_MG-2023]|uniref:DeoR/GlpR family DNA-binding transcription regulator n=1 Tax=Roseobacteraceae TaxID=2854170 RepID=UPI001FD3F015|nr:MULTISPECIES: DeoR/GlpR family DNA-binding transcription regulator [unclassified Marinovum]MCJ7874150.1 DeoR/GlpR family DNA-binding transcription regulator [Phaeobacter sp. J2-8]MDO6730897.1 DeoR/GlpR family DNA-binding transcription regulator [Marinovum sp. 2_MG-2023]MDO6780124.1 DeoR/GlpR family DNA-binding transcription regulator [Marinovum sp. 1_MG-2023]
MKRDDRQQAIMDLLVTRGEVDLDALSDHFQVSRMTIHRDLDDLETAGLLRKIRGGATIRSGTQFESDFRFRERQDRAAKTAMAEAAQHLVEPGMTVMINDGSMAAILGQLLVSKRPLTVISNNAAVIDTLRAEPGITLIALGGVYSAKFNAYLGKVTEDSLAGLRADICFISAPAVAGLEVFHMDDTVVRAKLAMMDQAAQRVLLVNHSRFDQVALHRLAGLSDFDHIITDTAPAPESRAALDRAGLTLTLADT